MPVTIQGNKIRLTSDFLYRYKDQITEAAQKRIRIYHKAMITLYWISGLGLYGLESEYEKGRKLEYLTKSELEDCAERFLNDSYGVVNICGYSFGLGTALKKLDEKVFKEEVGKYAITLIDSDYVIEGVNT